MARNIGIPRISENYDLGQQITAVEETDRKL